MWHFSEFIKIDHQHIIDLIFEFHQTIIAIIVIHFRFVKSASNFIVVRTTRNFFESINFSLAWIVNIVEKFSENNQSILRKYRKVQTITNVSQFSIQNYNLTKFVFQRTFIVKSKYVYDFNQTVFKRNQHIENFTLSREIQFKSIFNSNSKSNEYYS